MLHQHFVHMGNFDPEQAAFFNGLMLERIEDDYNDYMIDDEEQVLAYLKPAKAYFEYVERLIRELK